MIERSSRRESELSMAAPNRTTLFWILQIGGWTFFAAAMIAAGLREWSPGYTVANKLALAGIGFILTAALRALYRALRGRGMSVPVLVILAVPLSYGLARAWMAGYHLVLPVYTAWQRGTIRLGGSTFPDFTNAIYYSFVLLAWSALYFGTEAYFDLLAERERSITARLHAEQARLRALRFQLNPHFLFNTLNAISTLVADAKTAEANRMLSRLAEFLRQTLASPDVDEVALGDEIAFARGYLEIEAIRFDGRLRVDWAVASDIDRALVPAMILQPLVENAVRHAIVAREGGGAIGIIAERAGRWLTVRVEDDGPGLVNGAGQHGQGVGLANTRARLAALYGAEGELALAPSARGGLSVSIRLPLRFRPGAGA